MLKQPLSLTALMILALLGLAWASAFFIPRSFTPNSTFSPLAAITPTAPVSARLFFEPAALQIQAGQELRVNVNVDSPFNSLSAAQIFLRFDADLLHLTNWQSGEFWPEALTLAQAIDNQDGHAQIALGSFTPKTGQGALAQLTFQVDPNAQPQTTRVVFENGTQVTDPQANSSVLAETVDLILEIQ